MPDPITALTVGGGLIGSQMTSSATKSASETQAGAAQAGIDEQRRQNEVVQQLLAPYVQAGGGALGAYAPYQQAGAGALPTLQQYAQAGAPALEQQQALIGLRGPEAQRAAIAGISGGEQFKALTEQGHRWIAWRKSSRSIGAVSPTIAKRIDQPTIWQAWRFGSNRRHGSAKPGIKWTERNGRTCEDWPGISSWCWHGWIANRRKHCQSFGATRCSPGWRHHGSKPSV